MENSLLEKMPETRISTGKPKTRALQWCVKPLVFVISLLPITYLVFQVLSGHTGPNPIESIERATGEWSLRFLFLSLAMTPLAQLSKSTLPIKLRRMIGLFAFFYVFLHVLAYVVLDQYLNLQDIFTDVLERPYITAGFVAFIILIPLAATSNRYMVSKLKTRWKSLHRWVYVAAVAAMLHYIWLAKGERTEPIIYLVILLVLLSYRVQKLLVSKK